MPVIVPPDIIYRQIKAINVSVGVSAVQLTSAANKMLAFNWIILFNNHASNKVYFGADNTVTIASGMPILPQDYWILPALDAPSFDLWAIADGAATDLRMLFLK